MSTSSSRRMTVVVLSATALLTTSCVHPFKSGTPAVEWAPLSNARSAARSFAQLGFGPAASYRLCTPDGCPRPTRKTLSTSPPLQAAASAPAPAAPLVGATVERPSTSEPSPRFERIGLRFDSGSAELDAAARASLDKALPLAREATRIVISGRTDGVGGARVNQSLAFQRALAVRDRLLDALPDLPAAIAIDARGKCCYVSSNESRDGRAQNRRVEVSFQLPSDTERSSASSRPRATAPTAETTP